MPAKKQFCLHDFRHHYELADHNGVLFKECNLGAKCIRQHVVDVKKRKNITRDKLVKWLKEQVLTLKKPLAGQDEIMVRISADSEIPE